MEAFVGGVKFGVDRRGAAAATCAVNSRRPNATSLRSEKRAHSPVMTVSEKSSGTTVSTTEERAPASTGIDLPLDNKSDWKVKLLYDGDCPVCMKEVVFLLRKDAGRGLIKFVDISDENYNPADNAGVSWEKAMGRIHAILPDNSVVSGIKVFQKVYDVIGLGWLLSATKLPVLGGVADGMYNVWAKYRLRLTGRRDLEEVIAEKARIADEMEEEECEDTCQADYEEEDLVDLGLHQTELGDKFKS